MSRPRMGKDGLLDFSAVRFDYLRHRDPAKGRMWGMVEPPRAAREPPREVIISCSGGGVSILFSSKKKPIE